MLRKYVDMAPPCSLFWSSPSLIEAIRVQAIKASRKCPLHQDPSQANPIGSRPEDFLATDAQKHVCDEVLSRSFACHWDDIPVSSKTQAGEEEALINCGFFDREHTPTNLEDAQMLDIVGKEEGDTEENTVRLSVSSASTLFSGPMGMQMGLPQGRIRQIA